MVLRVTMDLFQHSYYRLNKILMTLIGQWPYQSTGARRGCIAALLSLTGNNIIFMLLTLAKYRDDSSILLDGILALLFEAVSITKFIGFMWHSKKTLQMLNLIRTDWHEWAGDQDVNILHRYAKQGRRITIAYLVMNFTNHSVFMIQPSIPKIIDVLLKNGTEPGKFPYPVYYYQLDVQKYYFSIIVFSYFCALMPTMVVATNGVMLICYVYHVCGIFAALGHKLKRLGNNHTLAEKGETRYVLNKKDSLLIASCIARHNGAIEYVNLIAASYTWTFFFTIGFGVILFNLIGVQILLRTNDPETSIRYVVFVLSIALYFYVECYISETVTDHSIWFYFSIFNNRWYILTLKNQKLLQFMAMRCSVSCQLTAGKMLVMSMSGFWLTSKTTISYLMFLRSMQE